MEPQNRVGVAQLTHLALNGVDLHPLRSLLLQQYAEDAENAGALMDLSVIDQMYGDREQGLAWQAKAFETCTLFRTYRGQQAKKKLLVFALPIDIGSNTPIEFLLPNDEFEIITYYLNPDRVTPDTAELPEHDVAFCAAPADAENAPQFYALVRKLTENTGTKVLNLRDAEERLDRTSLQRCLPEMPGLKLPQILRVQRNTLEAALQATTLLGPLAALGNYPIVIRPLGSHAGKGLAKLNSAAELGDYLARHDDAEFHVSEFVDYASPKDGHFRKARIAFIDGKAYPCHLAIADQWDVWYVNADMHNSDEKRREEEAFLEEFESDFGARHQKAFEALTSGLGMEYFGIDCSEDKDGNLVVFEADNSLIVHDLDSKTTFPYKSRHMARIFAAFEGMLKSACTPI